MQGILVLLAIIAVGLFGGSAGLNNGPTARKNMTPEQQRANTEYQIRETQAKIDELKLQLQAEEDKKNASVYKGDVTLSSINKSAVPGEEYITIRVKSTSNKKIPVTGWSIKSLASGNTVNIPQGTYLYFSGMVNAEENIILTAGETMYLVTGTSPIGVSFKMNKCSGYLGQFQQYTPYMSSNCPAPRNEDLSSIPKLVINDACFDYIDSFPSCKIQRDPLPQNWSSECKSFIIDKLNYPSCINTHKNDWNFYQNEWRVYLKRSSSMWKSNREAIVLYDSIGKVVDTLRY